MNNYVTDAINLKSYNLSEADKIVLMYSKDKGLIKGVAKGVKKPKSKLGGRMDMLVANKLLLFKGKNLDTVCQAEALNTFNSLRADMDKMLYAVYMSEIVANFGSEEDLNSSEIYDGFYKALSRLADTKSLVEILLCTMRFQLKMMKICGYELQLKNCVSCGCEISENTGAALSLGKGGLECADCVSDRREIFHNKLRDFLIKLSETDFDEVTYYDEKANEKVAKYCFNILKAYLQQHTHKKFNTLKLLT